MNRWVPVPCCPTRKRRCGRPFRPASRYSRMHAPANLLVGSSRALPMMQDQNGWPRKGLKRGRKGRLSDSAASGRNEKPQALASRKHGTNPRPFSNEELPTWDHETLCVPGGGELSEPMRRSSLRREVCLNNAAGACTGCRAPRVMQRAAPLDLTYHEDQASAGCASCFPRSEAKGLCATWSGASEPRSQSRLSASSSVVLARTCRLANRGASVQDSHGRTTERGRKTH